MIFPYFDIPIVGLSIDIFLCFNILLECYIPMVILTNLWSYSHVIYIYRHPLVMTNIAMEDGP